MQSEMPFYEGVEDALRAALQAIGGAKKVGILIWPDKSVDESARRLLDCLNPTRSEKLDYTQIMYIFREAKNVGCHAPFAWFASEIGYDVKPVTRAEEVDRLTQVVEQSSKQLSAAVAALERIQRIGNVKAV